MKIIHRPHNGELVYGLLVEIDEDGTETVVPPELICRVKPTTLKDETLQWVSDEEDKRLHDILRDAYFETIDSGRVSVSDILIATSDEGYEEVSTIFVSPDPGFLEHHVLCRNRDGKHVDLVFKHEEYEGEYNLSEFTTRNHDLESGTSILYLVDQADIDLAYEVKAICLDDIGYHTQVCLYRSVLWQCMTNGQLDQERLREFWRKQVRA